MRRMRTRHREQFHHLCSRRGSFLMTDPLNWKAEADAVLPAEHGPARMKGNAARLEVEFQYVVLELGGDPAKLGKSVTCRPVIETGRREKEEEEDDDDSGTQGEKRKPFEQDDEEDQEDDEDDEGDEDQDDEES
jgi:hypothetical protein